MRLIDIENKIKRLIAEDINNPEIYKNIYDLCYLFLMRRHYVDYPFQADEVATIMAEDLYMRILKTDNTISSWLGYISKYYHMAIRYWRKINSSEIIDTTNDYDMREAILSMSSSLGMQDEDYRIVIDMMFFDSIPGMVDSVLENSRYFPDTLEYSEAKYTILVSLCRGVFTDSGCSINNTEYIHLLYNIVRSKILDIINKNISRDTSDSLTLLQLYTLSNADINE